MMSKLASTVLSIKFLAVTLVVAGITAGGATVALQQLSPTSDILEGTLVIKHGDYPATKTATYLYGVKGTQGAFTPIIFENKAKKQTSNGPQPDSLNIFPEPNTSTHISFKGKKNGSVFIVPTQNSSTEYKKTIRAAKGNSITKAVQVGSNAADIRLAAAANATTKRKTGIIQIVFSDTPKTERRVGPNAMEAIMFSATNSPNNFYAEQSGGAMGFSGSFLGEVNFTYKTPSTCSDQAQNTALSAAAEGAITGLKINEQLYQHLIYVMPRMCGNWAGFGSIGGPGDVWINGADGYNYEVLKHELGHNLGLYHSNSYACDNFADPDGTINGYIRLTDTCRSKEYGDTEDPMGVEGFYSSISIIPQAPHFNAVHYTKLTRLLNWPNIPTKVVSKASTTLGSETITIAPISADCNQTKIIEVKRAGASGARTGDTLFVEYRQALPGMISDSYFTSANLGALGIQIRVGSVPKSNADGGDSQLIGTLLPGKILIDDVGHVFVKLNKISAAGAEVTVSYNAPPPIPFQ